MAADGPLASAGQMKPPPPLRVLVDTNVVLDLLLQRDPWYSQCQAFWQARDAGRLVAYLPASVLTDIYYISRRIVGNDLAHQIVTRCIREFGLLALYRGILEAALALPGTDFEDNVQIACANAAHLDFIVTRNIADFRQSPIQALEPPDLVKRLAP